MATTKAPATKAPAKKAAAPAKRAPAKKAAMPANVAKHLRLSGHVGHLLQLDGKNIRGVITFTESDW